MRTACLSSSVIFAQALGARGGDEFGLHRVQHAFAHQPRDFAGKIEPERDRRQDRVPRRFPERHGQQFPFDREHQNQHRRDHEAGNADGQDAPENCRHNPAIVRAGRR